MATNCDPSVLVGQAACLACIPEGMRLAVLNYLLCQIANNGAAGAELPSGKIFVGNASNVATAVTMSGDGTISNAGVFTSTKFASAQFALNVPAWTLQNVTTVAPSKVRAVLVCIADDANTGYQAVSGDEIDVSGVFYTLGPGPAFTVAGQTTGCRCQAAAVPIGNEVGFNMVHKNGNSLASPSSFANFRMKLYVAP